MALQEINKGLRDLIWKGRLLVQKMLEALYSVCYTLLFSSHEALPETGYFHLHGLHLGDGTISFLAFLYHFGYRSTPLKMITFVFFFIELTSYLLFCAMSITPCLLYLDVFLV